MSKRLELARTIHRKAHDAAMRTRNVMRAEVVDLDPLRVDLLASDEPPLEQGEDFELTQWANLYHRQYGIQRGDTVLMHREQGEWLLTDIVSDRSLENANHRWDPDVSA